MRRRAVLQCLIVFVGVLLLVQALASILNEVHHNTLGYISSEADSLIGTIAFTGILVLTAVLGLAGRLANGTNSPG